MDSLAFLLLRISESDRRGLFEKIAGEASNQNTTSSIFPPITIELNDENFG